MITAETIELNLDESGENLTCNQLKNAILGNFKKNKIDPVKWAIVGVSGKKIKILVNFQKKPL